MSSTPPSQKIIRGAKIEGFMFLAPEGESPSESQAMESSEIKSQESKISKEKSISNLLNQAQKAGYKQGLKEGQQQGYEAGKSEGLDMGIKQGYEIARSSLRSTIALLNNIVDAFKINQEEIYEQIKPEIIKFALSCCETLLRKELSNPKNFAAQIETLLTLGKPILKEVSVDIILAPEDLSMLEQSINDIAYEKEDFKSLNFVADKSIERGNCRLESSLGLVNFDINRLLSDLEKHVLEVEQD